MDTIELWARNGDAVREAMELGDLVHLENPFSSGFLRTLLTVFEM